MHGYTVTRLVAAKTTCTQNNLIKIGSQFQFQNSEFPIPRIPNSKFRISEFLNFLLLENWNMEYHPILHFFFTLDLYIYIIFLWGRWLCSSSSFSSFRGERPLSRPSERRSAIPPLGDRAGPSSSGATDASVPGLPQLEPVTCNISLLLRVLHLPQLGAPTISLRFVSRPKPACKRQSTTSCSASGLSAQDRPGNLSY
jgi:hypothetical protein